MPQTLKVPEILDNEDILSPNEFHAVISPLYEDLPIKKYLQTMKRQMNIRFPPPRRNKKAKKDLKDRILERLFEEGNEQQAEDAILVKRRIWKDDPDDPLVKAARFFGNLAPMYQEMMIE